VVDVVSTSLKSFIDTEPKSISISLLAVSSVTVIFAEPALIFFNSKSSAVFCLNTPTPAVPTLDTVFTSPEPESPDNEESTKAPAVLSQEITFWSSPEPNEAEMLVLFKSCMSAAAILASALAFVKY